MRSTTAALPTVKLLGLLLLVATCPSRTPAQDPAPPAGQSMDSMPALKRRSSVTPSPAPGTETPEPIKPVRIRLIVPTGAALQIALDQDVRVKKVGQPIHGRVVEPVYSFDQLVIPAGTQVSGQITNIANISRGMRTVAALDGDFTPAHAVEVAFNELTFANGQHTAVCTRVLPGSGQVIQFVTPSDSKTKQRGVSGLKDDAAKKVNEAKHEAKRQWEGAMKQLHQPGKPQRAWRYLVARLPVHPQNIYAGTVYVAELQDPLDFGIEPVTAQNSPTMETPPPGSLLYAQLTTALSSAISKKGDDVEATVSRPLLDGTRLILPQGSRLRGTVAQAQPARRMKRNGQLRIIFRELIPPDGIQQRVDASLEGVQAGQNENMKLDVEGGARATSAKSRYLTTAISLALAAAAQGGDKEPSAGGVPSQAGTATSRIAGGAVGFKLMGMVLGAAVHSRALGAAMGAYGASMSVYRNFIARGREIIFPRDTAMIVGIGSRGALPNPAPQESADKHDPQANHNQRE